jgi:hypothetical protein
VYSGPSSLVRECTSGPSRSGTAIRFTERCIKPDFSTISLGRHANQEFHVVELAMDVGDRSRADRRMGLMKRRKQRGREPLRRRRARLPSVTIAS